MYLITLLDSLLLKMYNERWIELFIGSLKYCIKIYNGYVSAIMKFKIYKWK